MGKIIAIANQKGGVGKTTTSVSLSAAIGKLGKKVLVVDMDPQGNTTSGYGINKRSMDISSYNVLMGERRIQEGIIKTKFDGVSVLGASSALAGAELELVERTNRTTMLKRALTMVKDNYDYIFIDCPPSLGLITLNCLTAADS
ncbi:MAG: ParA family protein, partial [Clostridiales bacterium]|nr:ParA family protein [Clostridiales bacterium]